VTAHRQDGVPRHRLLRASRVSDSGVYCVRVPGGDCGDLLLFDPRPQAWVLQPPWEPRGPASPQLHRLSPE